MFCFALYFKAFYCVSSEQITSLYKPLHAQILSGAKQETTLFYLS